MDIHHHAAVVRYIYICTAWKSKRRYLINYIDLNITLCEFNAARFAASAQYYYEWYFIYRHVGTYSRCNAVSSRVWAVCHYYNYYYVASH